MRYHIDTIPLWDAYHAGGECPLCSMFLRLQNKYVQQELGDAFMLPEHRVLTNEKGFCKEHFAMMYQVPHRLGLALITHTHTQARYDALFAQMEKLQQLALEEEQKNPAVRAISVNAKRADLGTAMEKLVQTIHRQDTTCVICDKLTDTMERYYETMYHMFVHEAEFKEVFLASQGLCLNHFAQVLTTVRGQIGGKHKAEFIRALCTLMQQNLPRVQTDLYDFTQMFDYKNAAEPRRPEIQDAVARALNKIKGPIVAEALQMDEDK